MSTRVTSTRLVGRAGELGRLDEARAEAAGGHAVLVLVGGDSGVGKTRLISELRDHARDAGATTLCGDCLELGQGELPYAPVVAALRSLVREEDPVFGELAPDHRAELARLLPGLGAGPATASDDSDERAQSRLFEALLALLDALGRRAPLVLAIEDIHWADASTRAFLMFLARSLESERLLVVATYRSDELHRRHPLRPLLAELDRDPRVARIDLAPLTEAQVAEALADILGRPAEPDVAARLFARSEGNPLYLEELLAADGAGRGALPSSLREALMVRIDSLSETAQDVLRLLAVGQRLDHALLSEASGLDPVVLRDALREAVTAHLVVADAEERYVFRHALLREVVADDLLPGERAELHRALARSLQAATAAGGGGPQVAAGIAHHFHAAGDRPEALVASVAAARAAEQIHAYGEAAALFERALELWDRVPDPQELSGGDHAALLTRAADAHFADSHRTRQEALLHVALDEVDEAADPCRAAALLERLARGQRAQSRSRDALETARRGLALVGEEPGAERARLLAFIAKTRLLQGKWRESAEVAQDALEAAREVGEPDAEIAALDTLGLSLTVLGDLDAGPARLHEAIALAERFERPEAMRTAYVNLAESLHLRGCAAEAMRVAREGVLRAPQRTRDWLEVLIAELAIDAGDWPLADEHLPSTERRLTGNDLLNIGLRRTELALGRGEHHRAAALLEEMHGAAADTSEPQYIGPHGSLRAELLRRQGDLDGAREVVEATLDRLAFCTEDVMRLAQITATGLVVEADHAERARDLGDEADARASAANVERMLEILRAAAEGGGPVELAWCLTGEAHAARARGGADAAAWAAAVDAWESLGRPYSAACARLHQAAAQLADDRAGAAETARTAWSVADGLGAAYLAREIEAVAARGRLVLAVSPGDDGAVALPASDAADDPFGLTPRERQVLAGVARGATNREIGAELFMAEKTASVHVSRILAKLDVRTRTEAAAVAYRLGLVDGAA